MILSAVLNEQWHAVSDLIVAHVVLVTSFFACSRLETARM